MIGKLKKIKTFDEKLDEWAKKYIEDSLIPDAKKDLKKILTEIVLGGFF